jgi:N utilization substance protein B
MLSRRNIRVKVMQVLYAIHRTDGQVNVPAALKSYHVLIANSFDLYLYCLLMLIRVAEYARQDELRKSAKLLPSEEDKNFSAILANNELVRSLSQNPGINRLFSQHKTARHIDADVVRNFYNDFAKTEEYKAYLKLESPSQEDHQAVLLNLFKFIIGTETREEIVEDQFPLWSDDKSLVVGAIKKTIKALPAADDFYVEYQPADDTVRDFGELMLRNVLESDKELLQLIEPSLRNWDVDRVAIIDLILLKMALTELIHFPSIPTKVTLNEFLEIAKQYSTDKSKDFINGILDRLMKKLMEEGLIKKEGRGLLE